MQVDDGLPELMCIPCVLQVSRAFTFKQQCQRSDQSLRSFIGQVDKSNESDNNNVGDTFKSIEPDDIEQSISGNKNDENAINDHLDAEHLDSELVLDALPSEIESSSFEEEIELSSLPSPVASEDMQQHLDVDVLNDELEDESTKVKKETSINDYFDELKLDVAHVVSLADDGLPDESIEATFGRCSFKCDSLEKENNCMWILI